MRRRKILSRVSDILFVAFALFAFWYTVFSRTATVKRYDIRLFWAFRALIRGEPEGQLESILYLENILFFIPFGLFYPWNTKEVKAAVVSAAVFSASIEFTQYFTACGLCEIDDIVANTIGAFIGLWCRHLLAKYLPREWWSNCKRN